MLTLPRELTVAYSRYLVGGCQMNEQVGWGNQQEDPGPVQEKGLCPGSELPAGVGVGGTGLELS